MLQPLQGKYKPSNLNKTKPVTEKNNRKDQTFWFSNVCLWNIKHIDRLQKSKEENTYPIYSNFWDFHLLTFLTKFYQFNLTFSWALNAPLYSFNQGTGLQWKLPAAESAILCPLSLAYMRLPSSQECAVKNIERTLFSSAL